MQHKLTDSQAPPQTVGTGGRAKLVGGAVMTALSRAFAQFSQIVIFVFAARTLGPEDFGLFALISAFAFVALKISEAGWGEYIMGWSGSENGLRKVVGIAWISGFVMALVGLVTAGGAWLVMDQDSIQLLIAGFAIWILLATPSAAWNGVMIWQGRIAKHALCGMAAESVGLVVTLLMLTAGFGVLSLVGGRLAQQVVFVLLALFVTRLVPGFHGLRNDLPGLISFSMNILASRLIMTLRSYAAVFIVGGFFGPAAVGYYRGAERVVGAFSELIGEPTRLLAWKTFRSVRDVGTPEAYQNFANTFFPIVGMIALPAFLWISFFAEPVIQGLLGPEWAPAAPVIAILSIAALLGAMGYATEPLLSLTGHTALLPRLFLSYAVLGILATVVSGPHGMIAVSVAQVMVAVVIFVVNLYVYRKKLGFQWLPVLRKFLPAVIPMAVAFVTLGLIEQMDIFMQTNAFVRAVVVSLPAMMIYVLLLVVFYRNLLRSLRRIVD